MLLLFLFHAMLLHCTFGDSYIYHLNESEYAKMPQLYHLDPYEPCVHEEGGVYCTVKFDIVTDEPSALYDIIRDYSAHTWTHFNHSQPQYGICLTKTCRDFYKGNETEDPSVILEACLNESFWKEFKLKTRVPNNVVCQKLSDKIELNALDISVAVILVTLLMFNIVGSLTDFWGDSTQESGLLNCFSIRRNWKKMTAPAFVGTDPRIARLKFFDGVRCVMLLLSIVGHVAIPMFLAADNPRYIEEAYYSKIQAIAINGPIMMQLFFVTSGFLMMFNVLIYEETHQITWKMIPKGIVYRWLRLTPVAALILAVTATWLKYLGSGPLWQSVVGVEIEDCQRYWWHFLLSINNYVDYSRCMPQFWYIAADTQLFILGLIVCVLVKPRHRTLVLTLLLVVGMILPAAHTYFQDLNAYMIFSPEPVRDFLHSDPTCSITYKLGHNNISSYAIGLLLGLFVYRWQKTNYQFNKFVKNRYVQGLTIPAMLLVIYSCGVRESPPGSIMYRTIFAGIIKPVFSSFGALFTVGVIFKFEESELNRRIFESDIWTVPARLTYCASCINMAIITFLAGTRTTLLHGSPLYHWQMIISVTVFTFVAAVLLYLLVEAPFNNLVKLFFAEKKPPATDKMEKHD